MPAGGNCFLLDSHNPELLGFMKAKFLNPSRAAPIKHLLNREHTGLATSLQLRIILKEQPCPTFSQELLSPLWGLDLWADIISARLLTSIGPASIPGCSLLSCSILESASQETDLDQWSRNTGLIIDGSHVDNEEPSRAVLCCAGYNYH